VDVKVKTKSARRASVSRRIVVPIIVQTDMVLLVHMDLKIWIAISTAWKTDVENKRDLYIINSIWDQINTSQHGTILPPRQPWQEVMFSFTPHGGQKLVERGFSLSILLFPNLVLSCIFYSSTPFIYSIFLGLFFGSFLKTLCCCQSSPFHVVQKS